MFSVYTEIKLGKIYMYSRSRICIFSLFVIEVLICFCTYSSMRKIPDVIVMMITMRVCFYLEAGARSSQGRKDIGRGPRYHCNAATLYQTSFKKIKGRPKKALH